MPGLFKSLFDKRTARLSASFVLFFLLTIDVIADRSQAAGKYSAAEQVYLKNITPVLYEYSQIASYVSASLIPLLSGPAEECRVEFEYYKSILGSLRKQLIGFTPPERLEAIGRNSLEAISDYETGVGLYGRACIEEDSDRKERLNIRAEESLNQSVEKIGRVYAEIENPDTSVAQTVVNEKVEITEPVISEGGNIKTAEQDYAVAGVAEEVEEVIVPPVEEEVVEEVETGVMTEEAPGAESPQFPVPEVKASEVATYVISETKTTTPRVTAPEFETGVVDAPENVPPVYDEPDIAETESEKPVGEAVEAKTQEAQVSQEEMSKEERIEKLNEIIMRRRIAEEEIPSVGTSEAVTSGAPAPEIAASEPGVLKEEITESEILADDIKSWCMRRADTETEQETCINSRTEAKEKIEDLIEAHPAGSEERDVVEKCKSDWKDGNTYNYEMVVSCIQFFCARQGMESCKELSN